MRCDVFGWALRVACCALCCRELCRLAPYAVLLRCLPISVAVLSYLIVFCLVVCSILCCVLSCVIFRDVLVLPYVFHDEVACYIVCVMFGGVAHLVASYVELFMLVGFICLALCALCHAILS